MKKGTSRNQERKNRKEKEAIAKIKIESDFIKKQIQELFDSAEMIAVMTEFNEVSFYVDSNEFSNKNKNTENAKISLEYIRSDLSTISLYFKYTLKNN